MSHLKKLSLTSTFVDSSQYESRLDTSPDWAQFYVTDKFGKRYWCETPPIKDKKNHTWYVNSGRMIEASRQPNPLWEKSLEVRPLEKKQTRNR